MFGQDSIKNLDDYRNKLSELKEYILDFDASARTQRAQNILSVDISEYERAVDIYDELIQKDNSLTESAAKKQAISEAFQNASDSARDYAAANDMTAESVSKFQQRQTVAIDAMQKTSLASRAAAIGMGLLNTALTSLAVAGASIIINAVVQAIDELIITQEECVEKAAELNSEYQSLENELQSLTSELNATKEAIAELEGQGTLTITEQGELETLKEQNAELERQIALKKTLQEQNRANASANAEAYFNTTEKYEVHGPQQIWFTDDPNSGTVLEEAQYYMDQIDVLNAELADAQKRQSEYANTLGETSTEYQAVTGRIAEIQAETTKYNEALTSLVSEIDTQAESLDTSTESGKQLKSAIDDLLLSYMQFTDSDSFFDSFVSTKGFERLDRSFSRMAENNELTAEAIAQNQEFVWELTQAGITIDEVVEHYNALAAAARESGAAMSDGFDLSNYADVDAALADIIERLDVINSTEINAAHFEDLDNTAWEDLQILMEETGMTLEQVIERAEELGLVASSGAGLLGDGFADAAQDAQILMTNLAGVQQRMDVLIGAYQSLANGEKLSASTMQELLNYYPQLESELMQYLTGMRTHTELMADLEELYQLDLDNWNALLTAKLENDSEFWAQWLSNNETWVDEFASAYGVDLSNYTSYAQAKMALMQAMINMQNMEVIGGRETTVDDTGAIVTGQRRVQDAVNVTEDAVKSLEDAFKQAQSVSFNALEGQFGSLQSAIDSTANSARDAASAIRSIASSSLSQINGLMDMTISMLKQDLQNQLDGIDASLDAMQDNYNAQKDNIEANRDAALDSIEDQIDALRDQKDAQDDMYDAQIDALRDAQDAQDKIYEDQIDALEDELDAYNKIIDAQIEMIRLKEEQHDYENELADKQKEVADIEAQLAELGLDDSIEAQKKRLELEEELAEKKEELEEFQHDKNIEDQITALENEKKQYEEEQQAAIDRIEAEKEAYDEMISVKIEGIQKAKEAFDDSIEAEINALQDQKDRMQDYYDSQLANLQRNYEADRAAAEAQKERIQAQINDEASLRQQAIELIEGRSQEFYNRLIEWNRQYGTGIDADVTLKWNNAYAALETFGGKQFDVLSVMNDLTFAADGFTASLSEAVAEAGNLQSALQGVLNMQSTVAKFNQASMIDAATSHGASPGGKPTPFAKYHEGGEVGKDNTISYKKFRSYMENLKSDEIPAILQKKEWVLTEEQQGNILKLAQNQQEIIDSFTRMYRSLSSALPDNDLSSLNRTLSTNGIPEMPESVSAVSGSEPINFFISTEITGNADDSVMDDWFAKNSEAFQDRFARYTLERINYKRSLRTVR